MQCTDIYENVQPGFRPQSKLRSLQWLTSNWPRLHLKTMTSWHMQALR